MAACSNLSPWRWCRRLHKQHRPPELPEPLVRAVPGQTQCGLPQGGTQPKERQRLPLESLVRAMRSFCAMLFGLLVLIALVPALSTALPNALFSK